MDIDTETLRELLAALREHNVAEFEHEDKKTRVRFVFAGAGCPCCGAGKGCSGGGCCDGEEPPVAKPE